MSDNQITKFKFISDSYVPEGDPQHFTKKIQDLGLTLQTAEALIEAGLDDVGDLCRIQMRHLYRIKTLRKKNVFEVLRKLQSMQLDFLRVPKAEVVEGEEVDVAVDNAVKKPNPNANGNPNAKGGNQKANPNANGNPNAKGGNQKANPNANGNPNAKGGNQKANTNAIGNPNAKGGNQKANPNANGNPNAKGGNINNSSVAVKSSESKWGKPNIGVGEAVSRNRNGGNNADGRNNRSNEGGRERREKFDSKASKTIGGAKGKQSPKDIGVSPTEYIVNSRKLREERSRQIEKKIIAIQPLKNADGLYKFFRAGKWGYKNEGGKVVIEPKYTEAFNFREGMACVEMEEKCGFIDMKGELTIEMKYESACSFSEGLSAVTADEKCGFIDKTGELVFPFEYEAATSFIDDVALVKKEGKWGYMDRTTGEIRLR